MLVFIIVVLSNRIKVDLIGFSLCYVAQLDADEELIWVFGCGGGGGGGGGLEGGERGGTGAAGRRRRRRKWVKWTNANRLSEPTVVSISSVRTQPLTVQSKSRAVIKFLPLAKHAKYAALFERFPPA